MSLTLNWDFTRGVYSRMKSGESGLSLAEALIALALMCIVIVPAIGMFRQSAANHSRAYADYQTNLAVTGLLARVKGPAASGDISAIDVNMAEYGGPYEFEVIVEDYSTGQTRVLKYPAGSDLDIAPAIADGRGDFSGMITAAAKDIRTGLVKIKALPY